MSDEFDQAHERLEQVTEGHESRGHTRRAAVIIAVMAACLALTEFAEKDAQTSFLSSHIAASDIWAQYQAKSVRRTVLSSEAELLESLPGSSNAAIQQRIAASLARANHMRSEPGDDGMEQLAQRAHAEEHLRDHEMHRKNMLEVASGGLQIAIVLASISVVIDLPLFMIASVLLGIASALCGLVGGLSIL
jgi:hypothetical protein